MGVDEVNGLVEERLKPQAYPRVEVLVERTGSVEHGPHIDHRAHVLQSQVSMVKGRRVTYWLHWSLDVADGAYPRTDILVEHVGEGECGAVISNRAHVLYHGDQVSVRVKLI